MSTVIVFMVIFVSLCVSMGFREQLFRLVVLQSYVLILCFYCLFSRTLNKYFFLGCEPVGKQTTELRRQTYGYLPSRRNGWVDHGPAGLGRFLQAHRTMHWMSRHQIARGRDIFQRDIQPAPLPLWTHSVLAYVAYAQPPYTGPVGRVYSNFRDHGEQVYLVPSNFCNWLSFFAVHCRQLTMLPLTSLLNVTGEGKKTREGNG